MSFNVFRDQKSFMNYFHQKPGPETAALYKTLVDEEHAELAQAWERHLREGPSASTVTELADACLDLIYVAAGLMHGLGLDPAPLWEEVHRSNIAKIKHVCEACGGYGGHSEGDPTNPRAMTPCEACNSQGHIYEARFREDGKVLKPPAWKPPALLPLVEQQVFREQAED